MKLKNILILLLGGLLLTGCAGGPYTYKVATGPEPFHKFDLPVYATDHVNFEFTELGIIRANAYVVAGWPDQQKVVEALVEEAKKLGADAVINLRIFPFTWSEGFLYTVGTGEVEAQGIAVKIKRP